MSVTVPRRVDRPTEAQIEALAMVLADCVAGGASVNIMWPFPDERALARWRSILGEFAQDTRV